MWPMPGVRWIGGSGFASAMGINSFKADRYNDLLLIHGGIDHANRIADRARIGPIGTFNNSFRFFLNATPRQKLKIFSRMKITSPGSNSTSVSDFPFSRTSKTFT